MQAFFVRQNDSPDSFIHVGTFSPDTDRSEHLAGVVAAGSALFAVANVWKMGLALQEIVRLSVCNSVDSDNRLIRNLQTNQTFLLWIELGLWSGFRRKMEIGEGFAHTLPTVLNIAPPLSGKRCLLIGNYRCYAGLDPLDRAFTRQRSSPVVTMMQTR